MGRKVKTFVKADGMTLAMQSFLWNNQEQMVLFEHYDVTGMSYCTTSGNGMAVSYADTIFTPSELNPIGNNAGGETSYIEQSQLLDPSPDKFNTNTSYLIDVRSTR